MKRAKLYRELEPGDKITVWWGGRKGTQEAVVEKVARTGTVYVRKWLANSGSWTQPVPINPGQLAATPVREV